MLSWCGADSIVRVREFGIWCAVVTDPVEASSSLEQSASDHGHALGSGLVNSVTVF
mgnify:CR=1 FL=1